MTAPAEAESHKNVFFEVERPTDGGTVFIKPPEPATAPEAEALPEPVPEPDVAVAPERTCGSCGCSISPRGLVGLDFNCGKHECGSGGCIPQQ